MTDPDAKPAPSYHTDRPSDRTPEEREAHYRHWLATRGDAYVAAVVERGGTPWFTSDEERHALWMKRYTRPTPPEFLPPILSLREINSAANPTAANTHRSAA